MTQLPPDEVRDFAKTFGSPDRQVTAMISNAPFVRDLYQYAKEQGWE